MRIPITRMAQICNWCVYAEDITIADSAFVVSKTYTHDVVINMWCTETGNTVEWLSLRDEEKVKDKAFFEADDYSNACLKFNEYCRKHEENE